MTRPGPKSYLDDDKNLLEIRQYILKGLTLAEISQRIGVAEDTIYDWKYRNYKGFNDKVISYEHERKLALAEKNLEELLLAEDEKVRADMTKFTLETLGKRNFSKKQETEITGELKIYKWDDYQEGSEEE